MAISIQPFDPSRSDAIADLNRRMAAAGSPWQFPEQPDPESFAHEEGSPVYQELFVAADGPAVRGGYTLQHRKAAFRDEECAIGSWYQPISEGSVDPRYSLVAIQMLRDAMRREPLCFGLGLEGPGSQLAKLATTLRCELRLVPFFVRIQNGQRFARGARYLRRRRVLAWLLDLAAATHAAGLAVGIANRALQRVQPPRADTTIEPVTGFGAWAEELWLRCRSCYSFALARDAFGEKLGRQFRCQYNDTTSALSGSPAGFGLQADLNVFVVQLDLFAAEIERDFADCGQLREQLAAVGFSERSLARRQQLADLRRRVIEEVERALIVGVVLRERTHGLLQGSVVLALDQLKLLVEPVVRGCLAPERDRGAASGEREVVVGGPGREPRRRPDADQAVGPAGECVPLIDHGPGDLREGERQHREVDAR